MFNLKSYGIKGFCRKASLVFAGYNSLIEARNKIEKLIELGTLGKIIQSLISVKNKYGL